MIQSLARPLFGAAYPALRLRRVLEQLVLAQPRNCLRVVYYHDVSPAHRELFERQLRWLAKTWRFVTPAHFSAMIDGSEPIVGCNLLLAFDDGFASNAQVAQTVLRDMNIKAMFFVISDFVDLTDRNEAREFICTRIQPGHPLESLEPHLYNMHWSDLEELLEDGHAVGGHTASHVRLADHFDAVRLKPEIVESADKIASRLGIGIDHFAYPFGTLASFGVQAMEVASRRFRFVHTGLRGNNPGRESLIVRRDALSPLERPWMVGAMVEGLLDFRYRPSIAVLDQRAAALSGTT